MLIHNWRTVLARAWSVRILALAAVLSGVEVMLPILGGKLPISDITRALIYFGITAAAFVARLVAQKKMKADVPAARPDGKPAPTFPGRAP